VSAWRQIEDAIARFSDGHARIVAHVERGWSSPTFVGAKHELTFSFMGEDATLIGEALLEELPQRQIELSGHLAVSTQILFVHRDATAVRLDARVEILVLEHERKAA
jgi:hypothetical protein